jgi:hypothetical protein
MPEDEARNESHRAENARSESAHAGRSRSERAGRTDAMDAPFAEIGVHGVNAGLRMQQQMFHIFEDIGRDWFTRTAAKAELASKLPDRLTAAASIPDAVFAYQQWLGEWVEMVGEDNRRIISDSQKIMDVGVRCFAETAPIGSS